MDKPLPISTPHVLFRLGRQAFAVPLAAVKDVSKAPQLTPVPLASLSVPGIAVLRDSFTTALDLRARFGLPPSVHDVQPTALAVDHEGERIALLVDRVEDVLSLPPLEPPPPAKETHWRGAIAGLVQRANDTIVVLDIAGVIDGAID